MPVYERLTGHRSGTLKYVCDDCGKESILDFSAYISPSVRPRELETCYHCESRKIKVVPYEDNSTFNIIDSFRLGFKKTDSALKERFQQIHQNTPGSVLDKASTITKI